MRNKITHPALKQIMKQIRTFQKYPDIYDFHARTPIEQQTALYNRIDEIIRHHKIVTGKGKKEVKP